MSGFFVINMRLIFLGEVCRESLLAIFALVSPGRCRLRSPHGHISMSLEICKAVVVVLSTGGE
jgi:hypothetical protein